MLRSNQSAARAAIGAGAVVLALIVQAAPPLEAQSASNVQAVVDAAYAKFKDLKEGKNADYIPALG